MLSDTFNMMFGEWDEQRAAEEQEYMAKEKAKVDEAKSANDWHKLHDLGFAQKVDGPTEYSFRWEFDEEKYKRLVADSALTPAQLADRMNKAMDR